MKNKSICFIEREPLVQTERFISSIEYTVPFSLNENGAVVLSREDIGVKLFDRDGRMVMMHTLSTADQTLLWENMDHDIDMNLAHEVELRFQSSLVDSKMIERIKTKADV